MAEIIHQGKSDSEILCTTCGLCCTGHLFTWAPLQPDEIEPFLSLGIRRDQDTNSDKPFFDLPCPLWHGECTFYPRKPRVCNDYQCKLLKKIQEEELPLTLALAIVDQAKQMVHELEDLLPIVGGDNYYNRLTKLILELENKGASGDPEAGATLLKAGVLLAFFSRKFGNIDIFNQSS